MQRFFVFMIMLCASLGGFASAQVDGAPGGRLVLDGKGSVGERMTATFDMGDYRVPVGQSVAVNVDVLQSPAGPRPAIVPGYPRTGMVFGAPGQYVLVFRLNEIGRSSCGGVTAKPLMESTEAFEIFP